jgi:uncharacterized repeat protein (TIGR01451 family)
MLTRWVLLAAAIVATPWPAEAQVGLPTNPVFVCFVDTSTAPPLIRAEGLAERLSDVVLSCSGGVAGTTGSISLSVSLSDISPNPWFNPYAIPNPANLTSRIIAPALSGTEAFLLIDDLAAPPAPGTNLIQGIVTGQNEVGFYNVPVVEPGPNATRKYRITNLRADARDFLSASIQASLSVAGTFFFPIDQPVVIAGLKARGAIFSLQTSSGVPAAGIGYQQPATPGAVSYNLVFTEGFAQSFRKRNTGTTLSNPAALTDQALPGKEYNTESGFYSSGLPAGLNTAGLATQGSRLVAQFKNVPAGVTLYVTVNPLPVSGAQGARLIAADANGAGAYAPVSDTATASAGGTSVGIAPVSIANGSGTATWEILDSDATAVEAFTFGVVVVYSGQPAGTTTITGGLGPLSTASMADSTSPVPRFADVSADTASCSTTPCLVVTPQAIQVAYQTGTAAPTPYQLQISASTGAALPFRAVASSSNPVGWLSVSASSATTPTALNITVNPTNVSPGVYGGTVVLSSPTQAFAPVTVNVYLTVTLGPSGYQPLACSVNSPVPPAARSEGQTELLGEYYLTCFGGTAQSTVKANVDVELTDPTGPTFTSHIVNGTAATEAILYDATSCGQNGALNPVQGILMNPRLIEFPNVTFTETGGPVVWPGCTAKFISNLRVDASPLRGTTLPPIHTTVRISGITAVSNPLENLDLIGAFVEDSLTYSMATAAGNSVSAMSFQQPAGENTALVASPGAPGGVVNYMVSFAEGYGSAFKSRTAPQAFGYPLTKIWVQNIVGQLYNSESGFYDPTLPSANGLSTAGLATQATRLMARITNIPPGVALYATVNLMSYMSGLGLTPIAQLVSTDVLGAGSYAPVSATTMASANGTMVGIAPLTVSGGTATAVWEVMQTNPNALEQYTFGLLAAYSSPRAGSAAVNASYAPLSTSAAADSSSPLPRFVQAGTEKAALYSPAPGVTLGGASVTFQRTAGSNVSQYSLSVGRSPGGSEYGYTVGPLTSFAAPGLPMDGRTVYVRLSSLIGGAWQYSDHTYIATGTLGTAPLLSITKTHTGNFVGGATGTYTIIVSNATSRSSTSGTVTVTDTAPAGLTLGSMSGTGWTCSGNTCSRTDALSGGSSYPAITVTAKVTSTFSSQLTNQATVSGGGSDPASTLDVTNLQGGCSYSAAIESSLQGGVSSAGATGWITVTAPDGCAWTATSNASWVTITSGGSGTGNGTLNFSVAMNPTTAGRAAFISVQGAPVSIFQPANQPPSINLAYGSTPVGTTEAFDFVVLNLEGWQELSVFNVLIQSALDGRNACYIAFVATGPNAGTLSLVDDAGDAGGPFSTMSLPGTGTVQNSQCSINGALSSVSTVDISLQLHLTITFSRAFVGNKIVYEAARDNAGNNTGWGAYATWNPPVTTPSGPAAISVYPSPDLNYTSSNGYRPSYVFTFNDTNGWLDIAVADILINDALDGRHACYLAFVPSGAGSGSLYLVDDAGDAGGPFQGMVLPGAGSIRNSQCAILGTDASVTTQGNTLQLTLPISFLQGFTGGHVVYLSARNTTQNSGWQPLGAILVPF